MMKKTLVLNVVGLSEAVIGEHTPFLRNYIKQNGMAQIEPMLPALTCSTQSTYLTGKWPAETGIVGNGWYDYEDAEIKFWKQSNRLVQAEKIWERAKKADPEFTVSNMFWWYNMYSSADYSLTPRPNYLADGRKIPDCYSQPPELRDLLQKQLGTFPLFNFWGPGADIRSSRWIASAAMITDEMYDPTLTLIYLPHLDYCQQKFGPKPHIIAKELQEIDTLLEELVLFYEKKNTQILILSEYGIAPVNHPIHINRILRERGLLSIRVERGRELLDAGASQAFAVADHQIAHLYVKDTAILPELKALLKEVKGIELILDKVGQAKYHLNHERSGDLVLMADADSWFSYYFWLDDEKAPDYARMVDIHKKPGYDPVEMFMSSKLRAAYKLLRKKAGLRYVMDVIPLDATLIQGSHGRLEHRKAFQPLIIGKNLHSNAYTAIQIYDLIWEKLQGA